MPNLINLKKNSLILFFLYGSFCGYAQQTTRITIDNEICTQCRCSFFKNDSIIYNSKSNAEGLIEVPERVVKNYTAVEVSQENGISYSLKKEFIVLSQGINFYVYDIKDSLRTVDLNEVVIHAKRNMVEDEGYKITYNAARDLTNTSVTTADVLRKTPMISVDIQGTPSLKGSQNVKVLVNHREIAGLPVAQILEQIPPGDIEKVEVITSPGARYEAEGTSGIINIITRKKIYFKSSGYANLGVGTKGSHLFANYSYYLNNKWSVLNSFYSLLSYSKTKSEQTYSEPDKDPLKRESDGKNKGDLYSYQFTLSRTSEKDDLTMYLNYYRQRLKMDEQLESSENQLKKSFTQNSYSFYKIGADYTRKITDRIKIDLSSTGFYLPLNNLMELGDYRNKYKYSIKNNTSYLNMELNFSRNINLNMGGKAVVNFFNDENPQTDVSARQVNFSAYLEGTYKFTNKFIVNSGARYEDYQLKGWSDIDKKYKDLFYNANLNYKFNHKTTLSFLFNKRTQRPSFSNLLPIENYTSSHVISVGNPDLNREISYNYEIGLSKYIGEHFIKISPFYRHINNKISKFHSLRDHILYVTYTHLKSENDIGISFWASTNFLHKKLYINYGLDMIHRELKHSEFKITGTQFLNNLNIIYKITDDLYVNLFGAFNTPTTYLQGKENSYTYSNLSIQKNFLKGNLRIAGSVDNPFSKGIKVKQTYQIENFSYHNQITYYNRGIRLFIIYKFGKKQPDPNLKIQDDILIK